MAGFIGRTLTRLLTANCLLFAVLGIVAIGFGILAEVKYGEILGNISYGDLSSPGNYFAAAPALLITSGVVILLISICGWWGARDENILMLKIYQTALFVTLTFCFIMAVLAFAFTPAMEYLVMTSFEIMFQAYNVTQESIDYFQRTGKCCGIKTFLDWSKNANWLHTISELSTNGSSALPPSCCIDPLDVVAEVNVCDTGSLHFQDGCGKVTWLMLKERSQLLESLFVSITVVVCFGLLLSRCVLRRIREGDTESIDDATPSRPRAQHKNNTAYPVTTAQVIKPAMNQAPMAQFMGTGQPNPMPYPVAMGQHAPNYNAV